MGSQEYNKRLLEAMAEVLKPLGFRKKGQVFTSKRDDVILLVELQKGKWTTAEELQVRVNFGAFSLPFEREWANRGHWVSSVDNPARAASCHWQSHGRMREDKWWGVPDDEAAERVSEEITEFLRETVLPTLENLVPISRLHAVLLEHWQRGRRSRDAPYPDILQELIAAQPGEAEPAGSGSNP
jgi:hypothetical protein